MKLNPPINARIATRDRIGGAITALVTPFSDGRVDHRRLSEFVEWQIGEGINGLAPACVAGEAPTLSEDERLGVIRCCVEAAAGRVPVLAGLCANSTETAVVLARATRAAGADAILLGTPFYNRPGQKGLRLHVETVARKVDVPIIICNDPARAAIDLTAETLDHLAALQPVVGICDASGDLARPMALSARLGDRFIQLSGHDATAFGFNTMGGGGTVSVVANLVPRLWADMDEACTRAAPHSARALHRRLRPLIQALALEPDPVAVKYALNLLRDVPAAVRLPLVPAEPATAAEVRAALAGLDCAAPGRPDVSASGDPA
jgi:4-hydroxy-tetrahydrodipicolinate synthase